MIRAHKIRLNPTPEQETYLRKACGTSRFAFNWGLARWKDAKEQGIDTYGPMAIKKDFNSLKREEFPWVMDVTKNACEDGFRRLNTALNNYFASKSGKRKGAKVGFPKFKSKKRAKMSFTLDYERFSADGHWLHISKLGDPINMAEPLRLRGAVKWATVSNTAGKWYVSIQVEMEHPNTTDCKQPSVGVDLGIKTLATLSNGRQFENQKLLRSDINRLKRLNRSLARRKQGSNRWYKSKRKLGRFHARIANQRSDAVHKMTSEITGNYHIVCVEDLNVNGMLRNRRLAMSLADAALGEALRQLAYKADQLVKVGRFFPSSKTCHECGTINEALTLADRQWVCSGCGTIRDRDWNAAKNIETEGLRLIGR